MLWDKTGGAKLRTFRVSKYGVNSVAFTPDGDQVLIGCGDDATLWETASGKKLRAFRPDFDSDVETAVFSSKGRYVWTGHQNGTTVLWSTTTARIVRTFKQEPPSAADASMGSFPGALGLSIPEGMVGDMEEKRRKDLLTPRIQTAAFSPDDTKLATGASDGTQMLTGHQDGTVCLWDTARMKRRWSIPAATAQVHVVAFSHGGEEFVTASIMERDIVVRNSADGSKLREFRVESDDSDGQIDVLDWFRFAEQHVPRLTPELTGKARYVELRGREPDFPLLRLK